MYALHNTNTVQKFIYGNNTLSRDWGAVACDTTHSQPVIMFLSASRSCQKKASFEWKFWPQSAQELSVLGVVSTTLSPRRYHTENISNSPNVNLGALSEPRGWVNVVFLTSWDKEKTVLLRGTVHQLSLENQWLLESRADPCITGFTPPSLVWVKIISNANFGVDKTSC